MEDIKINNIVQPTTPVRLRELGIGIVVQIDKRKQFPIVVAFSCKDQAFRIREFSETRLDLVTPTQEKAKELADIIEAYRDMQMAVSKV